MAKNTKKKTIKKVKKLVAKRPAKKPVQKKSIAKKKKATKKPLKKALKKVAKKVAKKPVKKVAAKKIGKKKVVKAKLIKRVPPTIVRRSTGATKPEENEYKPIDTAKAVAFAMSIAMEMKKSAAKEDMRRAENEIRLTRRPTTRAQGRSTAKFPASDLKEFKKRLMDARIRATNGVSAMKETGFNASEDLEVDGGDGTNQTLRLQALGRVESINRTIQQIDEALHRIEDGSYGVCTSCGQLIRKPRLLNQPFVLTCMECQSAMERGVQ